MHGVWCLLLSRARCCLGPSLEAQTTPNAENLPVSERYPISGYKVVGFGGGKATLFKMKPRFAREKGPPDTTEPGVMTWLRCAEPGHHHI